MPEIPQDLYRLIVTRDGSDVLVLRHADEWRLPALRIPGNCRPAAALADALKEEMGLTGLCIGSDGLGAETNGVRYQLVEARDPDWKTPENFSWCKSDSVPGRLTTNETTAVERAFLGMSASGPFGHLGWLDHLKGRLTSAIQPRAFKDGFRQLNSSEHFSVVRLETDGNAVWFKATGDPNAHERGITLWLTGQFPWALPPMVADIPEWNGWVTEEVGSSLRDYMRLDRWQVAVELVAKIQVGCIGKTEELLAAGAADHRFPRLTADVEEFFDAVDELMALQPKSPPAVMSRQELQETGEAVKSACEYLAAVDVPDTLMHGDISPGSIFVTENRCVIGDWCESYIGFPFLTFEHMLAHLEGNRPGSEDWYAPLREVYRGVWSSVLSDSQMDRIFPSLPLVAVFAHAVGRNFWRNRDKRILPGPAKYYRSLARRMWREAQSIRSAEAVA